MKKKKSNSILILAFCLGLFLLLYPTVSNYWNSFHQTRAIESYDVAMGEMDEAHRQELLDSAHEYNEELAAREYVSTTLTDSQKKKYSSVLRVSDTSIMGYIDIPKIRVRLPIYHGSSELILNSAVGHLEWTSLPVGGESTHCVLTGHRGLPSSRLFTDLDRLEEGDRFALNVLNETLVYQVDKISIVKPSDISELKIVPGEDYCTLLTCTPYGINTHRLLVRGHRVEDAGLEFVDISAEAETLEPLLVSLVVFAILLMLVLIFVSVYGRSKKKAEIKGQNKTD